VQISSALRNQLTTMSLAWRHHALRFGFWDIDDDVILDWQWGQLSEIATTKNGYVLQDLTADVLVRNVHVGTLRAYGVAQGESVQPMLTVQAQLFSQLYALGNDLHMMTGDLIETQDQLLAMYDLNRSLRSQLSIEGALTTLAEEAVRILRADVAFVAMNNHASVYPKDSIPTATLLRYVAKAPDSNLSHIEINLADVGVGFLVSMPLGQSRGVVGLLNRGGSLRHFGQPDIKLTRAIAEQGGTHLQNVQQHHKLVSQERLNTELEMAARIQSRLLPQHWPEVAGMQIFARSRQAQQVGGDFYDFVSHDGALVTCVGDVSGKGMSSALLMAMSRSSLRSRARSAAGLNPATLLSHYSDDLYEDFNEVSKFATVFVARYDWTEHFIDYCNAGHSPVLYYHDGQAQLIMAEDLPIGIFPDHSYQSRSLPFKAGDILLIGSDGFSEAMNDKGDMYGIDRLLALLKTVAHHTAKEIGQAFYQEITAFSGDRLQDDDQTLVVLKGIVS
jgi:phosphoserine phosphatase RsbU/P